CVIGELSRRGKEAEAALPLLREGLLDRDVNVRNVCQYAVNAIEKARPDPAAAERARRQKAVRDDIRRWLKARAPNGPWGGPDVPTPRKARASAGPAENSSRRVAGPKETSPGCVPAPKDCCATPSGARPPPAGATPTRNCSAASSPPATGRRSP